MLSGVLHELGGALFELVDAPRTLEVEVGELVIHDPQDRADVHAGDLVLGLGLDVVDATRLIEDMGSAGAACLVLKPPLSLEASVQDRARRAGVALLSIDRSASWAHAAALLRSVLTQGNFGVTGEQAAGVVVGDLFALANTIAEAIDAPVTIEDRGSRLLAYSGRQDEADAARAETIMERRVPARFVEMLRELGVFKRMLNEPGPVYLDNLPDAGPRVAISVRAGDEVLGSIWAAVKGPLSAEQQQAMIDSAKFAALHILRHGAEADVERRLRADLLATVLQGRGGVVEAASRLGLAGNSFRVLAAAFADDQEAGGELSGGRLWDALALHLAVKHGKAATALVGGVVYAVMPTLVDDEKSRVRTLRMAQDFVAQPGLRTRVLVGVGGPAARLGEITRSRAEADQALRVLRNGRGLRQVADIEDTYTDALWLRLSDPIGRDESLRGGRLGVLIRHDEEHNSGYVETLRAYLEWFGDVGAAAASLPVHPNTFRYRLRKLQSVADLELQDPDVRFGLMMHLRLIGAIESH